MKRHSRLVRPALLGAAVVVATSAAVAATFASRQTPVSLALFSGETGDVIPGSWGSGKAEVSSENVRIGTRSLKITTQGLYQGARLDFKKPVDLAPALANPSTYVRFQLRFLPGQNPVGAPGGAGGYPGGGSGGYGAGGRPGGSSGGSSGGRPGGVGGDAPGGAPGGSGGYGGGYPGGGFDSGSDGGQAVAAPFQRMRFLLVMADGSRHELTRPVDLPPSDDQDAYVALSFPISALLKRGGSPSAASAAPPSGESAKLVQMAIFGDKYQQFYLGEITVITDDTEINVDPLDDQIISANDQVTFVGAAEGGASTLRYSWDFDASDGIQEDKVGRVVQHTFRRTAGEGVASVKYKVTLTVSDHDGLKKPASSAIELDVAQ